MMSNWLSVSLLLAENAAGEEPAPFSGFLILMLPLFLFMIWQMFFGRSEGKERARREQMLTSLKKNDPVVTIGGIIGQFVSLSEDKQEVTIKVDENTRLKMQASAIRDSLVRDKDKDKAAAKEKA